MNVPSGSPSVRSLLALMGMAIVLLAAVACEGPVGPPGTGAAGPAGEPGPAGSPGEAAKGLSGASLMLSASTIEQGQRFDRVDDRAGLKFVGAGFTPDSSVLIEIMGVGPNGEDRAAGGGVVNKSGAFFIAPRGSRAKLDDLVQLGWYTVRASSSDGTVAAAPLQVVAPAE